MLKVLTLKRAAIAVLLASVAAGAVVAQQQGPARGSHDWAPPTP